MSAAENPPSASALIERFLADEARRLDLATRLALEAAARVRAEEAARKAEARAQAAAARALQNAIRIEREERKRANQLAHDDFLAARRRRRARSRGIPT